MIQTSVDGSLLYKAMQSVDDVAKLSDHAPRAAAGGRLFVQARKDQTDGRSRQKEGIRNRLMRGVPQRPAGFVEGVNPAGR
jgi:hypothetical protein